MKAEKIVLSFVAVLVGLVAAGVAFYLYQATKVVSTEDNKPLVAINPTPVVSNDENLFVVDSPREEEVFDKKTISIKGKTVPGTTIVISSDDSDQVVQPAENGSFSLTQSIPDGTSILQFTAIFPNGQEKKLSRIVTFTTESF